MHGMNRDIIDSLIKYENGEMETIEELTGFFQSLIDSGVVWQLQGHYGRTAIALIEKGLCKQT